MKGITHFISGAAWASFFPSAVELALDQKSFIMVLGGIAGILPDTLDFKFARFFERFDVEVDPDPNNLDPQYIAREIARAVNKSVDENRAVKLKLHTMKLGANLFRQYKVRWIVDKNNEPGVEVEIGPVVTMSKDEMPGQAPVPEDKQFARARLKAHVVQDLDRDQIIDIFGGPDMAFVPLEEGKVKLEFIPWHRRWSHSLVVGLFLGLLLWAVAAILGWKYPETYGLVVGGAFCIHVLEDQLGVMGSNLLWPVTRNRQSGAGLMHASDAYPNFFFVWLSVVLLIWNLNRFALVPPVPLWSRANPEGLRFDIYFLYTFIVPMTALYLIAWFAKKKGDYQVDKARPSTPSPDFSRRMKEVQDEQQEDFES